MLNIFKTIIRVGFCVLIAVFFLYILFIFNFYELNLQYKLMKDNTYLHSQQIKDDARRKAELMVTKTIFESRKNILQKKAEWIPVLNSSRQKGFKAYIKEHLRYYRDYKKEESLYKDKIKSAKNEARKIIKQGIINADTLKYEANKKLVSPLAWLFSGKKIDNLITGYFYDPLTGEVIPRLNGLNKSH